VRRLLPLKKTVRIVINEADRHLFYGTDLGTLFAEVSGGSMGLIIINITQHVQLQPRCCSVGVLNADVSYWLTSGVAGCQVECGLEYLR
jgi:hypothetical protein